MNSSPLFIIINNLYSLLLAFTFLALINFENTKISLLLAITTNNPKIFLLLFSLLSSFSFLSNILFIVILLY
jgi:hypothetical protein